MSQTSTDNTKVQLPAMRPLTAPLNSKTKTILGVGLAAAAIIGIVIVMIMLRKKTNATTTPPNGGSGSGGSAIPGKACNVLAADCFYLDNPATHTKGRCIDGKCVAIVGA